jgi:hypothetical protein
MPRRGVTLLAGLSGWQDFHTLKVEIGCSHLWGDGKRSLDWKANRWVAFPGVANVLCIALTAGSISFKLCQVARTGQPLPRQHLAPVLGPPTPTIVALGSRRLLGLDPMCALPTGSPDPNLRVDLYALFKELRDLW